MKRILHGLTDQFVNPRSKFTKILVQFMLAIIFRHVLAGRGGPFARRRKRAGALRALAAQSAHFPMIAVIAIVHVVGGPLLFDAIEAETENVGHTAAKI